MSAKTIATKSLRFTLATGLAFGSIVAAAPANAATTLCAAKADSADEEWVTSVKVGTGEVTNEQGSTYKDATASSLGTFAASTSNNAIEITVHVDSTQMVVGEPWEEFVFVWLDLNQDGQVDLTNERVFADNKMVDTFTQLDPTNNPMLMGHTFTGTFAVPATAVNGEVTGRAMLQFVEPQSDPILCNSDPDAYDPNVSAFEFGSVIDFKIDVTGGVEKVALAETGSNENPTALFVIGSLLVAAGMGMRKFLKRA